VGRAACVIKATDLVRPLLPFPELLDEENALRKSLAEQVQGGKISLLERNLQIQKLHSKIVDEEQSGLHAAPADAGKAADTEKQLSTSGNPDVAVK
jgi:DNA replication initiation complex subunit (GINS family)